MFANDCLISSQTKTIVKIIIYLVDFILRTSNPLTLDPAHILSEAVDQWLERGLPLDPPFVKSGIPLKETFEIIQNRSPTPLRHDAVLVASQQYACI